MNHHICFEQPMNELIRVCLKLESLLKQLHHGLEEQAELGSRQGIEAIVQTLCILDRPDFKSKLVKELQRIRTNVGKFIGTQHIDHTKLATLLNELDFLIEHLHSTNGKIGQTLRNNEFLSAVRQQLLNPGGLCGFELSAYWLWLNQPATQRIIDLKHWAEDLDTLHRTIILLMKLVRESTVPNNRIAEEGFFQTTLDPSATIQLLRIYLPKHTVYYPETSIGRHGISLRFYQNSAHNNRRQAVTQDVAFKIAICSL